MTGTSAIKIRPVILAGGFGKRLWPASTDNCPKQFAKLVNEESLFVSTLKRVSDRKLYEAPVIVGNLEHMFFITASLDRLGISDAVVMLEPASRNTAVPAIIAALHESEENILHLLMPADHSIRNEDALHAAVAESVDVANADNIVLFGIKPTHAETGYGYIIPGQTIEGTALREISVFTEKPNETFARVLINQGALWNSGIFLYDPSLLRFETRTLAPAHLAKCQAALKNAKHDPKCIMFAEADYAEMEKHSFDTLILESTKRGAVLPCEMEWNDVGSWSSLWRAAEKDDNGNALIGAVAAENVSNSYIHSDGVSIAAIGVSDCLIVASGDRVLVAPCSHAQEIKALYERENQVASNGYQERPWGTYRTIGKGDNFLIKQITIWPGSSISLQTHEHRAEHWIVLAGAAKTECDGVEKNVYPNESVFIPKGDKHRLTNSGDTDLQIIEVQSGTYIGEDDIKRFEDLYGRA